MKQETLEEAANRLAYDSTEENKGFPSMKMFIAGAKWQSERMYSEEQVLYILNKLHKSPHALMDVGLKEWLVEQFKKK
jgi:hypothetical protein